MENIIYKNNVEIVISRYNEDLLWLNEYPFNQFEYIVYNKGDNDKFDKTNVKVIILDQQAYWIKDNIFYKAPLVNQLIDKDSAEQVDTSDMNKVQLDQMLFILDKLREGINDDSRGSGDT